MHGSTAQAEEVSPVTIVVAYETRASASDGGSSSSSGHTTYTEVELARGPYGRDLRFDMSRDPEAIPHPAEWQWPVDVRATTDGDLSLLNQAELEERRDSWLKQAGISPDLCERWYFSWNAFQIDCDVEGVIETIRDLDIQPQRLTSGAMLSLPGVRGEGALVLESEDARGMHYRSDMDVDPDDVREAEARTAVVTGEILRQPVTYEAAVEKWRGATIRGTMHVILDADPAGQVWRRTVTREIDLVSPDGREEHRRTIQSVKRTLP